MFTIKEVNDKIKYQESLTEDISELKEQVRLAERLKYLLKNPFYKVEVFLDDTISETHGITHINKIKLYNFIININGIKTRISFGSKETYDDRSYHIRFLIKSEICNFEVQQHGLTRYEVDHIKDLLEFKVIHGFLNKAYEK